MKTWVSKALNLLAASLEPPRHELNELDWKAALSPDKKRLTEHLSALANQPGGSNLVFGVDNGLNKATTKLEQPRRSVKGELIGECTVAFDGKYGVGLRSANPTLYLRLGTGRSAQWQKSGN